MFVKSCLYMYIDLTCRLVNRREKGRSQTLIKFFKVKWIAKLMLHLGSIQLYNEFGSILFSAGHALTKHDLSFTIYCCSSVVYHNFVSSTFSCSKVSFNLLRSIVNVRLCITCAKCAVISSLPAFSWLLITSCLVKQLKLRASLKSGILSAYTIGLINELEK